MTPVAPGPTPAAQAVAVSHPRIEELKRYWVDLTTKSFSGATPPENLTPTELITAFTLGKLDLPKGDEPLMAYIFNALPLFCLLQMLPPRCSLTTLNTPLGQLQKVDSSLEKVVKVLETVATVREATPCFEMRITRLGQRLSKEQKVRVAQAYATFVELTGNSTVLREPLYI